ncbi:MAG: pyruvate kinase [Solirubrobacteraceae bacterium]
MRRTKIVATIGPASRDPEVLTRMIQAGLDCARLDFSQGNRELHAADAERVRAAAAAAGRPVAILLDLPGPRLRIGALKGGFVELKPSEQLLLRCGSSEEGDGREMSVGWAGLADDVAAGDYIFMADGAVRLKVTAIRAAEGEVETVVTLGGTVASGQGINVPGSTKGQDAVGEDDLELVRFGESIGADGIALSFVESAETIQKIRQHTRVPLIAKIEKPRAVDAAEEIIRTADCVMVARGDLGVELPIEDVPIAQKRLLRIAGSHARLSITATQMLDSMVASSRPTRAEAADVANAILDGTDAVMLSQETAIGAYPVDSVAMMASIAERTEHALPYKQWNEERVQRDLRDPSYTIAFSACAAARDLHVAALVVPTLSGRSARLISAHRPQVPILALSPGKETVQRCGFMWGVQAAAMPRFDSFEALIGATAKRVVELGWVKQGARVAITAGLGGHAGTTLLQIQRV